LADLVDDAPPPRTSASGAGFAGFAAFGATVAFAATTAFAAVFVVVFVAVALAVVRAGFTRRSVFVTGAGFVPRGTGAAAVFARPERTRFGTSLSRGRAGRADEDCARRVGIRAS
jgi:hypothetical protein